MVDETKKEWESHLNGQTTLPSCEQLMTFLEIRFRILDTSEATNIAATHQKEL